MPYQIKNVKWLITSNLTSKRKLRDDVLHDLRMRLENGYKFVVEANNNEDYYYVKNRLHSKALQEMLDRHEKELERLFRDFNLPKTKTKTKTS